jgi:hypothetical protein
MKWMCINIPVKTRAIPDVIKNIGLKKTVKIENEAFLIESNKSQKKNLLLNFDKVNLLMEIKVSLFSNFL